ncbi:MAG: hypothetical protein PHQ40_15225 [Anaerolineaceae bacterium]|nr:hypothetical protein [Anaerolineaceae bacterium]
MKHVLIKLYLVALMVALTACGPSLPKQTSTTNNPPTPAVTQDPSKGNVQAIILFDSNGTYLPFKKMDFYITPVISDPTGEYRVTGLDRATAVGAQTDEQGFVYFPNVRPGDYAIIIDNVTVGWLLPETTGNGAITVKVEAGKTKDLGTLKYKSLPITPVP